MSDIFVSILQMSISASVIALIVIIARYLLRNSPKIYSYILWAAVLLRLICPFSLTLEIPVETQTEPHALPVQSEQVNTPDILVSEDPVYSATPEFPSNTVTDSEHTNTPVTVNHVLNTVEQLFPVFQKAVLAHDLSISIVDAIRIGRNGESVAIFDGGNYSGAVFLYRLWNDFDGKITPAAVLLHELGHQLHFRLTGELHKVPNGFREFLNGIGACHTDLSDNDLLEVFADTFLLAVISQTREFGDPFPEVNDRTKRGRFEYMSSLSFPERSSG